MMLEEMQRQEEEQRRMPVVVVSQHANSDTGSKTKPVVMRGKDGELQFPGREEGSGDHGGTGAAEVRVEARISRAHRRRGRQPRKDEEPPAET